MGRLGGSLPIAGNALNQGNLFYFSFLIPYFAGSGAHGISPCFSLSNFLPRRGIFNKLIRCIILNKIFEE